MRVYAVYMNDACGWFGAAVPGSCDLSSVDVGNGTGVLWDSTACSIHLFIVTNTVISEEPSHTPSNPNPNLELFP